MEKYLNISYYGVASSEWRRESKQITPTPWIKKYHDRDKEQRVNDPNTSYQINQKSPLQRTTKPTVGLQIRLYTCGSANEKDSLKHRSLWLHTQRGSWRNSVMNSGGAQRSHSAQRYMEILLNLQSLVNASGATHYSWLWIVKDSFINRGLFIV